MRITTGKRLTYHNIQNVWRKLSARAGGRCAVAAALALIAYIAFFPLARPVTLDIGRVGDRLVLANWNGDERDDDVTYRWTKTVSTISVPGYGGVQNARIEVMARNGRGGPRAEVSYALDIGGAAERLAAVETWVPALADLRTTGGGADLPISLHADRFEPKTGDTRILGVQVDRVTIEPRRVSWWGGALGGWSWAARLALLAIALALAAPRRWSGLLGGGAAGVVALLAFVAPESRLLLPPLLVPATVVVGLGGVALRWRESGGRLGALWDVLDRRAVARWVVGALVVGYVVGTIAVLRRVDFIGHADYADNAVRARNIVRGHGDRVDYVAQFYRNYPTTITHPGETWPPLHVWLIAVAFRLFGVSTFAAKLPNVAVMAALLALVAWVGAWRWSRRVGLLAAAFLAVNVWFFAGTLAPQNDLVFTLLCMTFVVCVYRAWCEAVPHPPYHPQAGIPSPSLPDRDRARLPRRWRGEWDARSRSDVAVGIVAGLVALAKPSGAVLVVGAAGVAWLVARRARHAVSGRSALIAAGGALLCYAPWAVRNTVAYGSPVHTTESLDAWVNKYDPEQPVEGIYRLYTRLPIPHPRELVAFGADHFFAVQGHQFVRLWADLTHGALVPPLLLAFALLGALIGAARTPGLGLILAGAFAPYTLFVLLYWHYELRYFLVCVPWLCLFAAAGLDWGYAALAAWFAGLWQRALVPLVALAVLLAIFVPAAQSIADEARRDTGGNEMVQIAQWLRDNTPPDAVVMTRNPWEVSWHSGRKAVMLPLGTADDIFAVMRQYHVTVLELDHINDCKVNRLAIAPLYSYREIPGVTRLYPPPDTPNSSYLIYAVDPAGLRPLAPQPVGCGVQ